jgi:inner membrane protein
MSGLTHAAAGAAVALQVTDSIPVTGIIVLGSLLPDIDKGSSILGRYFPLSFIIPHRTVTHCILFIILCYAISPYLAVGVLTHYILDMLNPDGIPLLWPVPFDLHLPIIGHIESGGVVDHLLMIGLTGYILYSSMSGSGTSAWV